MESFIEGLEIGFSGLVILDHNPEFKEKFFKIEFGKDRFGNVIIFLLLF